MWLRVGFHFRLHFWLLFNCLCCFCLVAAGVACGLRVKLLFVDYCCYCFVVAGVAFKVYFVLRWRLLLVCFLDLLFGVAFLAAFYCV